MSTQDSRGGAAGLRDRRVARVLDREISPVWHDRFARLIVRNLPALPEVLALDVHCGTGRGTSELLHRLGAGAKVLAIDPDEGALELAKTRIRPEWKNRVYFKAGHFDDITAMADDSYNLVVANLVLGESVDLGPALGEMIRVCKIGGRLLATVPLHGTWDEVEDIFAEILRDAGMTAALRRLDALRAIRPTGPQLGKLLRNLGCVEDDYVIEHERFQLLFPSGREFLFAPVIEHGPLQMWKAVIGKDGAPQELFWRLKEAIDTYYAGHVLAVTVHAGLVHVEVAKGTARPGPRLAARFWRHYPELDKLWGGLAVGYARVSDPILPFSEDDIGDFDLDIDIDESDPRRRTGAVKALKQPTAPQPVVETPSPEDFGLRFRNASEASGARPLDSEASGARLRPPGSEASGLRALSQLRDSEISSIRPATSFRPLPLPADEDDFSELNRSDTGPLSPVPAASSDAAHRLDDEPPPEPEAEAEDDFSDLNDELALAPPSTSGRRPIPDAALSGRRPLSDAEASGSRPVPGAALSGRRPLGDAEASGSRPVPGRSRGDAEASGRLALDGESSARRALEELRAETQAIPRVAPEPAVEAPAEARRTPSGPTAEARRTPSGPTAEARRTPSGPTAEAPLEPRRAPSGPTAEAARPLEPDLSPTPAPPHTEPERDLAAELAAEVPGMSVRPSVRRPREIARPPSGPARAGASEPAADLSRAPASPEPAADLSRAPAAESPATPTDLSARPAAAESSAPPADLSAKPATPADLPAKPAAPARRAAPPAKPAAPARRPEPSESEGPPVAAQPRRTGEPVETPRPSLPSFRLPEPRPAGGVGTMFRPPSFKPPGAQGDESKPPARTAFRPPPKPAVEEEEEEPEEIDELEPVEEIEPEEAPKPPVAAAPRPPPPRVPPPPRPPNLTDKKK